MIAFCFLHFPITQWRSRRRIVPERCLLWPGNHAFPRWLQVRQVRWKYSIYLNFSICLPQVWRRVHARMVPWLWNLLQIWWNEVWRRVQRWKNLGPWTRDVQWPHKWIPQERRLLPRLQAHPQKKLPGRRSESAKNCAHGTHSMRAAQLRRLSAPNSIKWLRAWGQIELFIVVVFFGYRRIKVEQKFMAELIFQSESRREMKKTKTNKTIFRGRDWKCWFLASPAGRSTLIVA